MMFEEFAKCHKMSVFELRRLKNNLNLTIQDKNKRGCICELCYSLYYIYDNISFDAKTDGIKAELYKELSSYFVLDTEEKKEKFNTFVKQFMDVYKYAKKEVDKHEFNPYC